MSGGTAAGFGGDGAAFCGSEGEGPRGHRLSARTRRGRPGPGRHGGSGPSGDTAWWAVEGRWQMTRGSLGALFPCVGAGGPWSGPGSTGCGVLLRGALGWGLGGLEGRAWKWDRGRTATGSPRCVAYQAECPGSSGPVGLCGSPSPVPCRQETARAAWKDLSLSVCASKAFWKRENGFVSGSGPKAAVAGGSRCQHYFPQGLHDGESGSGTKARVLSCACGDYTASLSIR